MKHLLTISRIAIGCLFVYASYHKLFNPGDFAVSIRNYTIIPVEWTNLVALGLPWVELVTGFLLIAGIQTKPAALLATGMLGIFLGAIIYAYYIGLDIDCGCFSSSENSTGRVGFYHIVRDSSLFLLSLAVLLGDSGKSRPGL